MTKRDQKELGRYIRWIADEIGLRDWQLHLLDEPSDDDCNAQTRMIYGRKMAAIRVSAEFRDFEPERIRTTICHELIHLHFAAVTHQSERDLTGHLSEQALDLFWSGWLRNFEYGIDGLAHAFAPHMPLIEWATT